MPNINTDLRVITNKIGKPYTIRIDRRRVFFPEEWNKFFNSLKDKNKPLFDFMINSGARVEEALFIRLSDFDFDRYTIKLWKTKTKAKKGETTGKPRTISLSTEYCKRVKKYFNKYDNETYLFKHTNQGINQLLKNKLKSIGVSDYYNFSSHNIRKTHGMYLKAIGIDIGEICTRLGHDYNTYIQHYGSADIFSDRDIIKIKELLGDLYSRQRKF